MQTIKRKQRTEYTNFKISEKQEIVLLTTAATVRKLTNEFKKIIANSGLLQFNFKYVLRINPGITVCATLPRIPEIPLSNCIIPKAILTKLIKE